MVSERARSSRWWRGLLSGWLLLLLATHSGPSSAAQSPLDLKQHLGKVVVVDFWASWCVPCRRSFPWLNAMQKKYADQGLVIIGVNLDQQRGDAQSFLAETPAEFAIVYDPAGDTPREYAVMGMPSSYVFDRQGRLVARHIGFQNARRADYEQVLLDALNGRIE